MDIEFHYYITYIIALQAGFENHEAYVLAYASQYVDDNTRRYRISQDTTEAYANYFSQTSDIMKPEMDLMRVYPIFHFMPGNRKEIDSDTTLRRDGKLHVLNTVPDNGNARTMLRESLGSGDLYRIGIAIHMFADTWAHQNFVGYYESFNSMKGVLQKTLPNVGHADAKHNPDWPALVWNDDRLMDRILEIDNKERFLSAAERIFEELCRYRDPGSLPDDIEKGKLALRQTIDRAIGSRDEKNRKKKDRIAGYRKIIGSQFIEYAKDEWLNTAVELGFFPSINRWADNRWRINYEESHWYRFQEAIKSHQRLAMENILMPIIKDLRLERI